jgi:hypothetical protein
MSNATCKGSTNKCQYSYGDGGGGGDDDDDDDDDDDILGTSHIIRKILQCET